MATKGWRRPVVSFALASLAIATSAEAAPPNANANARKSCFSAYENVQLLMKRSHLREAREAASACLADACPTALRADCGTWLKDIEARMPSVVIECTTASGKPVTDARLTLDGAPWKERPDGIVSEIDPGEHVIHAEVAGRPPVEKRVIVPEGKKAQRLTVEIPDEPSSASDGTPPPRVTVEVPQKRAPVPVATYVLAGVGALSLGGFAFFAIQGKDAERGLETCSPRCNDDVVGDVRQRYIVADVLLGVSVVSLGIAAYLLLASGGGSTPSRTSSRQ